MVNLGTQVPIFIVDNVNFSNHEELFQQIDTAIRHLAAAEGTDFGKNITEIRLPYNLPIPSFFDGLTDYLYTYHHQDFIATVTGFNWGCIHPKDVDRTANPYKDPVAETTDKVDKKSTETYEFRNARGDSKFVTVVGRQPKEIVGDAVATVHMQSFLPERYRKEWKVVKLDSVVPVVSTTPERLISLKALIEKLVELDGGKAVFIGGMPTNITSTELIHLAEVVRVLQH